MSRRRGLPVGRLVAEFAVIVFGVLVALLAESAWQERGERLEERAALERIRTELARDSIDLELDESWLRMSSRAVVDAELILAGTDTLSDRQRLAVLYAAILKATPLYSPGTWQDLTASGRSDLVSDPDLRSALVAWYDRRDRREEVRAEMPVELRGRVLSVMPVPHADSILETCVLRSEAVELQRGARDDAYEAILTCEAEPEGGARVHVERILSFPDNGLHLNQVRYGLRTFRQDLERSREAFDALVAELDRVLEEGA